MLMDRKRDSMRFEAKLHGFNLEEDSAYMDSGQVERYMDSLVKATNGASPAPRS